MHVRRGRLAGLRARRPSSGVVRYPVLAGFFERPLFARVRSAAGISERERAAAERERAAVDAKLIDRTRTRWASC